MYIVVFRTVANCNTKGAITWTPFPSKAGFDAWFDATMKRSLEVVEEGITEERAIELCTSLEARSAVFASMARDVADAVERVTDELSSLPPEIIAKAPGLPEIIEELQTDTHTLRFVANKSTR